MGRIKQHDYVLDISISEHVFTYDPLLCDCYPLSL